MLDIINSTLLINGRRFKERYIRIAGDKIIKTGCMSHWKASLDTEIIDAGDNFICPGFIDIHNHGALLADAMDASSEAFDKISEYHLKNGVTSYLLTTMTAPLRDIKNVFKALKCHHSRLPVHILGCHMEGPFLSAPNAGAHPQQFLRIPDEESLRLIDRYRDCVKLITAAPNLPCIDRLLSYCREHGIIVSGGHDNAIDTEIESAILHGLSSVTHIYCCSSGISRRAGDYTKHLGITQIGLNNPDLFCEVIADSFHIPDDLFKFIYKCKGFQKICLVSDGLSASGLSPGQYYLGSKENGVEIIVDKNVALLKDKSAFAGSITPIASMVSHLVSDLHVPLEKAVYMASSAPAKLLKLANKGCIQKGFDAELNILDGSGHLIKTIIGEHFIHSHHKEVN